MSDTKGYLDMELLRFTTAGSVDDGKSTLIGRLLYDSKSIFEDQLEVLEEDSQRRGEEGINLALLTDGLRAMGLSDGMVRMSVGLDNDIERTFQTIKKCMKQTGVL